MPSLRRTTTYTARKLRSEMTLPEVLLWNHLRASKLGLKFRRQHPIDPYVVDFYCSAARLIVEIDGEVHDRGDQPLRDRTRDLYLANKGYRILRVGAVDVLRNMDSVLMMISTEAGRPLHHSVVPLPASGEDFQ